MILAAGQATLIVAVRAQAAQRWKMNISKLKRTSTVSTDIRENAQKELTPSPPFLPHAGECVYV